jgi:hypothetical protein
MTETKNYKIIRDVVCLAFEARRAWPDDLYASASALAHDLDELFKRARTLTRLSVRACNGETTEKDRKREETNEARIRELCAALGFGVKFDGDPGAAVVVSVPSGNTNNFGRDGIRIG